MKTTWIIVIVALLISSILLPAAYFEHQSQSVSQNNNIYFGVTFGSNSTANAKALIDKVKGYTNFFIVDSWDISINETALNEICDYAVNAGLSVMVYFDFISYVGYPWLQGWLNTTKERWGDSFLGIYLYDEPGGRQIDTKQWHTGNYAKEAMENASNYDDAAYKFITSITESLSNQNLKLTGLPLATSDYALYWFDYLAEYDIVFAELGGTNETSKTMQIDLCRGAANVQGKQWGAIITWSYDKPPYLENGTSMLQDMVAAYHAGAKYIVIFNYAPSPHENPYGTLTEDQFDAMKDFWNQIHSGQQSTFGTIKAEAALVLPKNYGWGMRTPTDTIWGLWNSDIQSPLIWTNMDQLLNTYGLRLDIIYNDTVFNFKDKYSKIYYWNT
jgi:hypothetical protein